MNFLEKIFTKKSPKNSAPVRQGLSYRNGSLFLTNIGSGIETTTELYYKLYRSNTDIKGAVHKKQSAVGKDGFFIEKNGEKIEHEELKKIFKNFRFLKSSIVRDIDIAGGAFILPVKNALGGLHSFQILDPRSIKIVANKYGEILKFIQRIGTDTEEFEADELFYLTEMMDPDNEVLGLSKIENLIYDVMGDDEAMKSNYAFFKNNAVPNSIVILDERISEENYQDTINQLKKQFAGGANRHKVSTNVGIKDIKTIGQSNKDMEFISLRQFTTDKVCAGLSVPKTILGYHDGVNFSTADNHYRTFIEETIRPLEDLIADKFTEIIAKFFPNENIRFCFVDDRDFDRTAKIDEYIKMLGNGLITIDEARVEMGYNAFAVEGSKKPIIKQGFEFVEDIGTTDLLPENQVPEEK